MLDTGETLAFRVREFPAHGAERHYFDAIDDDHDRHPVVVVDNGELLADVLKDFALVAIVQTHQTRSGSLLADAYQFDEMLAHLSRRSQFHHPASIDATPAHHHYLLSWSSRAGARRGFILRSPRPIGHIARTPLRDPLAVTPAIFGAESVKGRRITAGRSVSLGCLARIHHGEPLISGS